METVVEYGSGNGNSNALPQVDAGLDQTVCDGTDVTLSEVEQPHMLGQWNYR